MLFNALHSIAAQRGDGLRKELFDLLEERRALSESGVSELAKHTAHPFRQAGPNPISVCPVLLENVTRLHDLNRNDGQRSLSASSLTKRSI